MKDPERDAVYAQIGRSQRLFSQPQIELAAKQHPDLPLGKALVKLGVVDTSQHEGVLRAVDYRLGREEDKRLAQVLVEHRYCDQAAVKRALEQQKTLYHERGECQRLATLLLEGESITDGQHLAARKILQFERAPRTS